MEEVSARLLRRGATEPSLVLPPRSALSGAPMRLSRLPEDLAPQSTQDPTQERPPEERPPEESLVRDLVLSRVRRSPEKHMRKRVTSPALLGAGGPSVRPLPPPVPGSDAAAEGGVEETETETETVVPPPPLTQTRRIRIEPPPPPPPPSTTTAAMTAMTQSSSEWLEQETKLLRQTETVQMAEQSAVDQASAIDPVNHPPFTVQPTEAEAAQKATNDSVLGEKTAEFASPAEKTDQPPPLPDKTRGSARLSLIPAAARALFSPPRRPPRASDQRTPRRKKQSAVERRVAVADGGGETAGQGAVAETGDSLERGVRKATGVQPAVVAPESPDDKNTAWPTESQLSAVSPGDPQNPSVVPAPVPAVASLPSPPSAAAVTDSEPPRPSMQRNPTPPEGNLSPTEPAKPPQPSQLPQLPQPTSGDQPCGAPNGDSVHGEVSSERQDPAVAADAVTQTQDQSESPSAGKEGQESVPSTPVTKHSTPVTRKKESSDMKKKRERRRSIIQTISGEDDWWAVVAALH